MQPQLSFGRNQSSLINDVRQMAACHTLAKDVMPAKKGKASITSPSRKITVSLTSSACGASKTATTIKDKAEATPSNAVGHNRIVLGASQRRE